LCEEIKKVMPFDLLIDLINFQNNVLTTGSKFSVGSSMITTFGLPINP
jgi:hypothetical protein